MSVFDFENEKFGLVFRKQDTGEIYLGVYEDGLIESFHTITDGGGIYDDMRPEQFSLVQVENVLVEGQDGVVLRDLRSLSLSVPIQDVIDDGDLGPITQELWEKVIATGEYLKVDGLN